MVAVLLAGGPGAGKSAVASELRDRGLCSIDLDFGFAQFEDSCRTPVSFPVAPDLAWLDAHHWQWIDDRLRKALAQYRSRNGIFCGTAFNMFDHLDRFALAIVLHIDDQTLEDRLRDPRRYNVFGKVGDTAAWAHWWRDQVESELRSRGTHAIDGRQPLDRVVDEVLAFCAAKGYPVSRDGEDRSQPGSTPNRCG